LNCFFEYVKRCARRVLRHFCLGGKTSSALARRHLTFAPRSIIYFILLAAQRPSSAFALRETLAFDSHTLMIMRQKSAAGVERHGVESHFWLRRRVVFWKLIVLCGGGSGPLNCSAYTLSKRFSKNSHSRQEATQLIINVCRLKKSTPARSYKKFASCGVRYVRDMRGCCYCCKME